MACSRLRLSLIGLALLSSLAGQTAAGPTAPRVRLDTPAYRSAVALAQGQPGPAPLPAEAGERGAFLKERALWLLRLEQWKLAEQDYFAALQKSPGDPIARAGLAWAGLRSGRVEAARNRIGELQQEFPDYFAVSTEAEELRAGGLARIARHVLERTQAGSLVAGDLAESPYDFGEFQLDALLEDAESALESGSVAQAEGLVESAAALGAPDLPALQRCRARIAAAREEMRRLEPGDPELAETRYLIEQVVAQAQAGAGRQTDHPARSGAYQQVRTSAFSGALRGTDRPTIHARRRLLARWLALRAAAEPPAERESVRGECTLAARLFASTPNEGDAASDRLAVENLALLRQIAPHWPLSEVASLPSAWPDGPLLDTIAEITGGAPLIPGDPRLKKAVGLWQIELEAFAVDHALDRPEDAVRLGDHYRIGAALAVFERQTLPEADSRLDDYMTLGADPAGQEPPPDGPADTPARAELTARINQLVRMSSVCANYPATSQAENPEPPPEGPLHAHFDHWPPAHRGQPKAGDAEPIFAHLEARAWALRQSLAEEKSLPGPLPWRQIGRSFEAEYAGYVGLIQSHDRPFLLTLAQLRRKAGDLPGTLDLLPLLEQRNQLGYEIENRQLPATTGEVYPAELSAFVRSLRGASPALTAYADLTAWIEEVNRTRQAGPLPPVPPELLASPAVALQWTWAQIISRRIDDAREALRPAEANAKDSASFGLVAPELMLRALSPQVAPLYERGWNVWNSHSEDFDPESLKEQREACTGLMRRLLEIKASPAWKSLQGGDRLEYKLAFAAGDFALAAKTEAGVNGERYVLHAAQSEAAASEGLLAFQAGKLDEARAKLKQAEALEVVPHPQDRKRDDSNDDGEYVLILRALTGYCALDGIRVKGGDVVGYFEAALKETKLPAHAAAYRKVEDELRWRADYVDHREQGRTNIARYLRGVIFEKAERNPAFERAHFLDPVAVKGLIDTAWIDLHQFKDELTYHMPAPPAWDGGHRVTTDYVENPAYFAHHGNVLAAIARKDYEEVQRLGEVPKMIPRQREYVANEPPFWGYYRTIYRALK